MQSVAVTMRTLARLARVFPRNDSIDRVTTRQVFEATPEEVWRAMMFYEEVPGRPSALLRAFLPAPIRSRGAKTTVGARIACEYEAGHLEKRISATEHARYVHFEVSKQALGIEDAISMCGGAYELRAVDGGTEVLLTTRYHGHARPRWLWRIFERFLAHRLHHHILNGMQVALQGAPAREALPVDGTHPAGAKTA